jgi:hypothetical protein
MRYKITAPDKEVFAKLERLLQTERIRIYVTSPDRLTFSVEEPTEKVRDRVGRWGAVIDTDMQFDLD